MPSTTEIGDELRDHIIDLLEARGFQVDREVRIDTKRVDVLVHFEDEFERRRIALECKNAAHNLSQKEVALVYVEHQSLITTKQIDGVWIVAARDFSPEAKNWASNQYGLKLFTAGQFEERQFGFRKYVRQLTELFKEQQLDQYYIPQRYDGGKLLIERTVAGKESIILDLGLMLTDLAESRRPKITISNRAFPIPAGEHLLIVAAEELDVSDTNRELLIEAIRS